MYQTIIKKETKFHDFIGVVVSSSNSKWNAGEIRFNFVRNSDGNLEGYFYNKENKAVPVTLPAANSRIGENLLKKIDLQNLKVNLLVNL